MYTMKLKHIAIKGFPRATVCLDVVGADGQPTAITVTRSPARRPSPERRETADRREKAEDPAKRTPTAAQVRRLSAGL
jgi:hypothetical protein